MHDPQSGSALVIVLAALVLMAALVVAFFLSVTTEMAAAKSSSQSLDARRLADTPINIVIAQIKDATTGADATGLTSAWASQPGLIRTFSNTGSPSAAYKLYSCPELRDSTGNFDPLGNDQVPAGWYGSPALYTDLNAPVFVPDPNGTVDVEGEPYSANYPVLDPSNLIGVKGFSIVGAPVSNGSNPNPAPMPVQWLYVLQNGAIVPATVGANAATTAVMTGGPASASNPIVGRIAFWTDDETCKVNINTAAGDLWNDTPAPGYTTTAPGSYCDMPLAINVSENILKNNQPTLHEYQRYPGHPATTYLSAVFPDLLDTRDKIFDLVPRVSSDPSGVLSSLGGTRNTLAATASLPSSDPDHLYSSVDELAFAISEGSLQGGTRPENPLTSDQVKQATFFLTAQSRAPELNLFSKPRIGMWPQLADTARRTVFDKTIAACSTMAGSPYYFVRSNPVSPTFDFTSSQRNQSLYAYLQNLTDHNIPGFGGRFLAKYPSPDGTKPAESDQILTEMFDYIRSNINLVDGQPGATVYAGPKVTDMKSHTTGGPGQVIPIHIGATMGFGRTETLFEPVLHIVATEMEVDPAAVAKYDKNSDGILQGRGNSNGRENANLAKLFTKRVQVALLLSTFSVAHGPSRFVPNLYFEVTGMSSIMLGGQPVTFPGGDTLSTAYGSHATDHEYGWGSLSTMANLFYKRGGGSKTWGSSDPKTEYPFVSNSVALPAGVEAKSPVSLESGPMVLNIYAADSNGEKGDLVQSINFRFLPTTVPAPYMRGSYTRSYVSADDPTVKSASRADGMYFWGPPYFPNSLTILFNNYKRDTRNDPIIRDATRGLSAAGVKGDMRLVAAMQNVPATYFTPLPGYFAQSASIPPPPSGSVPARPGYNYEYLYDIKLDSNPDSPLSDGMICGAERSGNMGKVINFSGGLVAGVTYDTHYISPTLSTYNLGPAVSWGIKEATLTGLNGMDAPGDWDNGMGSIPDGPYINKADEGEVGAMAYSGWSYAGSNATTFSPNRQVPSPAIFGSLSSGVISQKPWQTLLFCPNPPAKNQHPGFGVSTGGFSGPNVQPPYSKPPDHLLLDLFAMPVVEPYAISEPFSTAGKVNMNYQIAPFTYIKRSTALQAVLRSTKVGAIPTADGKKYKSNPAFANPNPYRLNIDLDKTLLSFDDRFQRNQPFRSASEICQMFLVPTGVNAPIIGGTTAADVETAMTNWWENYKLTGDNLRERPYSQIYSRLTTKSNTYTVHARVQSLKKVPSTGLNEWVEGKDLVVGEYRGSFTIERFIDPNDPDIATKYDENYFGPDQTDADGNLTKTGRLDPFYRFRVVTTKQFSP